MKRFIAGTACVLVSGIICYIINNRELFTKITGGIALLSCLVSFKSVTGSYHDILNQSETYPKMKYRFKVSADSFFFAIPNIVAFIISYFTKH